MPGGVKALYEKKEPSVEADEKKTQGKKEKKESL